MLFSPVHRGAQAAIFQVAAIIAAHWAWLNRPGSSMIQIALQRLKIMKIMSPNYAIARCTNQAAKALYSSLRGNYLRNFVNNFYVIN